MLKSIRDITGQKIDRVQLEEWYSERDKLKKGKNSKNNRDRIKELQRKIYNMMFIPQYITVSMENVKSYRDIYENGFSFTIDCGEPIIKTVKNKDGLNEDIVVGYEKVTYHYKRLSCSASQARVSTVVFCEETILPELKRRLDNGRNMDDYKIAPSKYNAYFGLYSSAIKEVTKPRFCIIPDYSEVRPVDVDFVIEQPEDQDDIVEERTVDVEFNMVDGSGLISPQMAEQWGKDLGEDYTPCQFCIRCAFTKGAVNEFDFVDWCKELNNENYLIKDVYGNYVDVRNIDVILTEGMAKLWSAWDSQESFEENCQKNGIIWGVTKYAPKQDKEVNTANYQFLQTLNLTPEMVKDVCKPTVDYIQGVSYDNIYYTLLFLLGENLTQDNIENYMKSSDNYWLKSLVLNNSLLYDKYSKEKVRDFIIRKIELACLGKIMVHGNFQCIVVDGYAFMQAATGQKVTGLLNAGEMYSQFWNKRNVTKVDTMRSPLTHFSEHYPVELKNTEEMKKWYKYSYSGVIVNCHDAHTMHWAGSDYDYDIIFTCDNPNFINGVYPDQRVVTYNAKKPHKKPAREMTDLDLYNTDTFSFGTRIGQITNICSTFVSMLPLFEKGSKEEKLLQDRVRSCCAAQSRQIDKTKIGENVKAEATIWKQYQHINPEDSPEEIKRKEFLNSLLADKKPYFFRYKYNTLSKEYNEFVKKNDQDCQLRFACSLKELLAKDENLLNESQKEFIRCYKHFLPVVDSDCVMNQICKYIENIDFHIREKVRSSQNFDYHTLMSDGFVINKKIYEQINDLVSSRIKEWAAKRTEKALDGAFTSKTVNPSKVLDRDLEYNILRQDLLTNICSNEEQLANHLIYLFYVDKQSYNKNILWALVGRQIYENIRKKTSVYYFPQKNPNGSLEFLYEKYSIERVLVSHEEEIEEEEKGIKEESFYD